MVATFTFDAELFQWDARDDASWVFAALPIETAEDVRELDLPRAGFGSIKVAVRCGSSSWRTSIFPDTRSGSFVLPVKKAIRKKEQIDEGDIVAFEIDIDPE